MASIWAGLGLEEQLAAAQSALQAEKERSAKLSAELEEEKVKNANQQQMLSAMEQQLKTQTALVQKMQDLQAAERSSDPSQQARLDPERISMIVMTCRLSLTDPADELADAEQTNAGVRPHGQDQGRV